MSRTVTEALEQVHAALPGQAFDHFVDRYVGRLIVEVEGRLTSTDLVRLLALPTFDSISTALVLPRRGSAVAVFQIRLRVDAVERIP